MNLYLAECNEISHFVFISDDNKEWYGWIEDITARKILTFDGQDINSIIKDKNKWLSNNGFKISSLEFDEKLTKAMADSPNPLIAQLMHHLN